MAKTPMKGSSALVFAIAALPLSGCETVSLVIGGHAPAVPLSKAEIRRCLELPHKVGDSLVSPVPRPGNVFKPGYNFSVRQVDGSYGFGHQEAAEGRVIVRYPAQHKAVNLEATRRNGVVYFGDEPTNCR